jgi:hypothetical protein
MIARLRPGVLRTARANHAGVRGRNSRFEQPDDDLGRDGAPFGTSGAATLGLCRVTFGTVRRGNGDSKGKNCSKPALLLDCQRRPRCQRLAGDIPRRVLSPAGCVRRLHDYRHGFWVTAGKWARVRRRLARTKTITKPLDDPTPIRPVRKLTDQRDARITRSLAKENVSGRDLNLSPGDGLLERSTSNPADVLTGDPCHRHGTGDSARPHSRAVSQACVCGRLVFEPFASPACWCCCVDGELRWRSLWR